TKDSRSDLAASAVCRVRSATATSPMHWTGESRAIMEDASSKSKWPKMLALAGGVVLVAWQGWMALALFRHSPQAVLDDRPLVSGRHPLHLYHGYLGARALRSRGAACSYDPAFQAGYPKTPVFDDGSRPAELVLAVAGGDCSPRAYKLGLFCFVVALPLLLW